MKEVFDNNPLSDFLVVDVDQENEGGRVREMHLNLI